MEKALEYLEKNKLKNIVILEVLRRGSGNIIMEDDNGVLIFDEGSSAYMMTCKDIETAKRIIELIPKEASLIVAHEEFYIKLLQEKFNICDIVECNNAVYMKDEKIIDLDDERTSMIKIKILNKEHIEEVEKLYSELQLVGDGYIKNRIMNKEIIGAFIDNNLVGFIGFHEEGSMGMLEIKKEYRRRGIGKLLEKNMINYALERGKYPYGQVIVGNEKSLQLQKSLGLEISNETVFWLNT